MANPFDETDPSDKPIHKDIESTTVIPSYISRFRIERMLGEGTFGSVFLAIDEQLQRTVAIKVAKPKYVVRSEDRELYLAEARNVASLEHPNIVPVYDVGSTDEFPIYIVSRFIEGRTLAETVRRKRMEFHESALLVAKIAEALHYAHLKKLVHRDIKPGNILIDSTNEPFLVDFGLALREEDTGNSHRFAGTPSYMSPEQARGEGHRVDGRSDLFSLGVTFYELLVGKRPFISDKKLELLDLIVKYDPRPPRQCDDTIPKELERICLKALSKRPSERHTTGHDLAEDLRHFLESGSKPSFSQHTKVLGPTPTTGKSSSDAPIEVSPAANSDPLPLIKPKGLRSFEKQDSEFFLDLLPGQRDRAGFPSSIGFWKERIEERDEIETFSVGLVYGPSGCGKSSLMKAGLLPRLSESIVSIYLEATPDQTERNLNTLIRKRLRDIPLDCGESLVDLLTTIRRKAPLGEGKKLLLVIDQFEQWLFAHPTIQGEELLLALSQCDGTHLQAIVMVREDFWMGITRFFRELDLDLDRRNSAAVDLFDKAHAKKVLVSFGKAFGRLPEDKKEESKDQTSFLNEAIDDLAENGKIISVRLSLFAEMMKDKEWTIHALQQVGGTLGIGATFLEENFSISTAPPKNRLHQAGARKILAALLPVDGTDIKGHMRSSEELLAVSGYGNRSKDFQELIKILDTDLRLITPVERSELTGSSSSGFESSDTIDPIQRFYQLTHDYVVPSLRDWLTRKQAETRKGRAELKLEERSSAWNLKREHKQLPSLLEWISIQRWTSSKDWSDNQTKMMRKANQHYGTRSATFAIMAILLSVTGLFIKNQFDDAQANKVAREKVRKLLTVETSKVPDVLKELQQYRSYADPLLKEALQSKSDVEILHAKMALVGQDSSFANSIIDQILNSDPPSIPALCHVLKPHRSLVQPKLQELLDTESDPQFLRAAAALVALGFAEDENSISRNSAHRIAGLIVRENPLLVNVWAEQFSSIGSSLGEPLANIAVEPKTKYDEAQVRLAIDVMNQKSYRQAAIESLNIVLAEKIRSLWDDPPINPEWKGVPKNLLEKFQQEDGAIDERFAFHPALKSEDLQAICQTLKECGYRPDRAEVVRLGEKQLVGIIWHRDGKDFDISLDVATEEIKLTFPEMNLEDSAYRRGLDNYEFAHERSKPIKELIGEGYRIFSIGSIAQMNEDGKLELFTIAQWLRPKIENIDHETVTERKSRACIALSMLGFLNQITSMWNHDSDPTMRNFLINLSKPMGVPLHTIEERLIRLQQEIPQNQDKWTVKDAIFDSNTSQRRALIQSLGEFSKDEVLKADNLKKSLLEIYRTDPDAGIHGVCRWTLGRWGLEKEILTSDHELKGQKDDIRRWEINSLGMTMVKNRGPVQAWIEKLYERPEIKHNFAIGMTEVTFEQYAEFEKANPDHIHGQIRGAGVTGKITEEQNMPITGVSWFDAAAFCNWLSDQEGISRDEWCYLPNADGKYAAGMEIAPNIISRFGYRLPIEAEWEYACRAETNTPFSFGRKKTELELYGWYIKNSDGIFHNVGLLRPNAIGLFDIHGNLSEWCLDGYSLASPELREMPTQDHSGLVTNDDYRCLRGGNFNSQASENQSSYRSSNSPGTRYHIPSGFRLAKTYP